MPNLILGNTTVMTESGGTVTLGSSVLADKILQIDYGMHSSTYYDSGQGSAFPGTTLPGQLGDGSVNLTPTSSSNFIEISYTMHCGQHNTWNAFFFRTYYSVDGGSTYAYVTDTGGAAIGYHSGWNGSPFIASACVIKPVTFFTSTNQNIKFRMNSCKEGNAATGLALNVNTNGNDTSKTTNFSGACSSLIVKELKGPL